MGETSKQLTSNNKNSILTYILPLLVWVVFILTETLHWTPFYIVSFLALVIGVIQAVHHAEVVAEKIGEPFGALVLALAVTMIEVSIIISLMLEDTINSSVLARDTVFASVMIILTGMLGLVILVGGIKYKNQEFSLQGAKSALTVLVAISVLTLILPNFTTTVPGAYYSTKQLAFVVVVTLILYGSFLFAQNISHKSDFISANENMPVPGPKPTKKQTLISAVLLVVFLVAVVLLAETMAHPLEILILDVGAPREVTGIIVASIILLPEGISAVKAVSKNQLQSSLNLTLGSSLATIGLTIPMVSIISLALGLPISLGVNPEMMILFLLALFIIVMSLSTGRTTILQGVVLLVVFSVYLLTVLIP